MTVPNRKLCVAPMLDWTDRHCRVFHRLLAPGALLYTEMVTTGALLHGDRERHLAFNPQERPLALQLGGCDPAPAQLPAGFCAAMDDDLATPEAISALFDLVRDIQIGRHIQFWKGFIVEFEDMKSILLNRIDDCHIQWRSFAGQRYVDQPHHLDEFVISI